jgi:uncharacterized CHY-type Zn-finger protein
LQNVSVQPKPSPDYPNDWCAYHQRVELITDETYRACFECWHAFTEEELINETAKRYEEMAIDAGVTRMVSPTDANKINACPLCTHDF